ncbi:MAG: histidinol-phosphate transaminase [Candidatus Hydrogenedens sp.]|jgi:histidinol-phosphate aminotransferase|nr:histidinol-phosphate transaminase [Candidatus Hydrogenedens sp.]
MAFGRKIYEELEGYTPGEQPKEPGVIKLNTNENPYPPSPRVLEALQALSADNARRYPDPVAAPLRRVCAEIYGLPGEEWLIAGNGMDELLALVLRAFVDPGDTVLALYPTYSLYEVLCRIHDCQLRYIDADENWQPPESFYEEKARLCFLTRPNAPTGLALDRALVEKFCTNFPGIVVIDEAYVDFADDHCMDFPERFENVIVMRTFSKSYSLAGLRIGIAAANPALIREFMKIKDSYNMNAWSQEAALAAVQDQEYMHQSAERVRKTRKHLREQLLDLGFTVHPSQTNFLLAHWAGTPSAAEIFETLRRDHHILVRYFNHRRLDNALRITIGTDEECAALVHALQRIIGDRG